MMKGVAIIFLLTLNVKALETSSRYMQMGKVNNLYTKLWSTTATVTTYNKTQTAIQCAARCSQNNSTCGALTFEPSKATCILGTCAISQPVTRSPSVDLYQIRPTFCNSTQGFKLETNGNSSACLWWSETKKNFTTARYDCLAKGAILATFKTYEKFQILKNRTFRNYIGLDDMEVEGTFRWHDDNSILDMKYAKTMFVPGDPNNINNQDCISSYEPNWLLADVNCWDVQFYVCENICLID